MASGAESSGRRRRSGGMCPSRRVPGLLVCPGPARVLMPPGGAGADCGTRINDLTPAFPDFVNIYWCQQHALRWALARQK